MDSIERQKHLNKLLIYNVSYNKVNEAVEYINLGADVDAKDQEGVPVLALAAEKGNLLMTKMLLKEGADLLETDAHGVSVYERLMRTMMKSCVEPQKGDALLYMTALYVQNVFEGRNRYNGKRQGLRYAGFVESVISKRKEKILASQIGDRERG